jgi:hypothetical protein
MADPSGKSVQKGKSPFRLEALSEIHNRAMFQCGVESLDRYFREQVTQDVRRRISNCFVAVDRATERPTIWQVSTPCPHPVYPTRNCRCTSRSACPGINRYPLLAAPQTESGGTGSPLSRAMTRKPEFVHPYGHFATGGMDDRIDSTLPPVFRPNTVPRS